MRDYMELGSSPAGEECVQLDENNPEYYSQMSEECHRYKEMLKKRFPIPNHINCRFGIKSFPYENGAYQEVVVYFDDEIEDTVNTELDAIMLYEFWAKSTTL